jgi:hypothetical protein
MIVNISFNFIRSLVTYVLLAICCCSSNSSNSAYVSGESHVTNSSCYLDAVVTTAGKDSLAFEK